MTKEGSIKIVNYRLEPQEKGSCARASPSLVKMHYMYGISSEIFFTSEQKSDKLKS